MLPPRTVGTVSIETNGVWDEVLAQLEAVRATMDVHTALLKDLDHRIRRLEVLASGMEQRLYGLQRRLDDIERRMDVVEQRLDCIEARRRLPDQHVPRHSPVEENSEAAFTN